MSIFPEMNDDKAAFFALSLIKNICISFDAAKFESDDQTSGLYRLLDKLSSESKDFHKDPVIRSFFSQIQCFDATNPRLIYTSGGIARRKHIGFLWENTPSPTRLIKAMRENGLDHLSRLVSSMSSRFTLEQIMTSTLNNLNFIEGGNEIALYGIDLVSDIISKYEEKNETVFTGDCHHEDVLITQDTGEIFPRVQQAIQLKMDYMATVRSQTVNCTYLDVVCFTGVIITRNGEPLFRVPLTFHGHSAGASLNTYGIEFRTALNSKGASAYSIDFDNIEVCQAHSPELKLFSKGLPRRAARTLNGAALQDELGM